MTDGNTKQLALEKTSVSLAFFGKTKKRLRNTVFANEKFYSSAATVSFDKRRAVISSKYDKQN